ncbi:Hypothetical protein FKW44_004935 [Caligus rogercresseyi]|uniref:Uncharacterized protein n=1 Tax=Caligus rogercresseyi TaxID=217165 RepID=A0A7T8KAX0_CALRO|nr:Hypothetical protein FKW44_004935 [Caligus rogercresseyi]
MNYLRFRLQNSPFIKYGKDAAGRPPSQPLTHVLQTHSRPEEPKSVLPRQRQDIQQHNPFTSHKSQ